MSLSQRRVEEVMARNVFKLGRLDRLDRAEDLMRLGRFRHIPVVEGGRVVGIVTSRDLLAASLSNAFEIEDQQRRDHLHSVDIGAVMSRDVISVGPNATLRHAAGLMVEHQIGCVPVVDPDGQLLGLVTESDLLREALLEQDPSTAEILVEEGGQSLLADDPNRERA